MCEDPTLPILDNIDCPNESCIVNIPETQIKNNITLSPVLFNNRNDVIEEIDNIMKKAKYEKTTDIEKNNEYSIKTEQTSLTIALSKNLKNLQLIN